jgi:hypothetical protein
MHDIIYQLVLSNYVYWIFPINPLQLVRYSYHIKTTETEMVALYMYITN